MIWKKFQFAIKQNEVFTIKFQDEHIYENSEKAAKAFPVNIIDI